MVPMFEVFAYMNSNRSNSSYFLEIDLIGSDFLIKFGVYSCVFRQMVFHHLRFIALVNLFN